MIQEMFESMLLKVAWFCEATNKTFQPLPNPGSGQVFSEVLPALTRHCAFKDE